MIGVLLGVHLPRPGARDYRRRRDRRARARRRRVRHDVGDVFLRSLRTAANAVRHHRAHRVRRGAAGSIDATADPGARRVLRHGQRHGARPRRRAGDRAGGVARHRHRRERTTAFAWYNVLQDVGHAAGSLLAAAAGTAPEVAALDDAPSLRCRSWSTRRSHWCLSWRTCACRAAKSRQRHARRSRPPRAGCCQDQRCSPSKPRRRLPHHRAARLLLLERFGVGASAIGPLFFGARMPTRSRTWARPGWRGASAW